MPRCVAVVIALLTVLATPSLAAPGSVSPGLAARVAREGRTLVVVELAENALPEGWLTGDGVRSQRRRVVASQIAAIYDLGATGAGPVRPYPVIPFLAVEVGPAALAALAASPHVRSVAAAAVRAPQLAETVPQVQADLAWAMGLDGAGQTVVVLDTGTDGGHDNFPPGKIVEEACFADGATTQGPFVVPQSSGGDCPGGGDTAFGAGAGVPCDYAPQCFHGTHVSGIAVGSGPVLPGVASGAGLIPIQVFSEFPPEDPTCGGASCPLSWSTDQDAALLHVYDTLRHAHPIASVNMSLGSGAYTAACDGGSQASTKAAIDQLRSVGIPVVVATGNNSCDGTGCRDAISAPACISSAVSVSAHKDTGLVAAFANASSFMSLFAPGVNVLAPRYNTTSGYKNASGTSMAAPHVAGAWAILLQAVPGASVTTLLGTLQTTGLPVWGGVNRIQIEDALASLGFPLCDDGMDNDGDGAIDGDDPGCDGPGDAFERSDALPCDDGMDNDEDGAIDTADPGCRDPGWVSEAPQCNDGIDNDGDGGIDFDGSPADADCWIAFDNLERAQGSSCGLGPELALLLPLLLARRRRRGRA